MKYVILVYLFSFFAAGCGLREREMELEKRTNELNRKEQELLLKIKSFQLQEEELLKRQKQLDSSSRLLADSFLLQHPKILGKWNVTMHCTETTCPGSAIGDIKNEQWEISYQNKQVIAQAYSDNKLVRIYSGNYNGSAIELSTGPDNPDLSLSTNMIVRIQEIKENEMRGKREIIRPDNCRIIYDLLFKKQ
jgi:hypothetical protein